MVRLFWLAVIGLVAGWIAGQITKGRGFGAAGNLFVGVLGAMLGGLVFNLLGLHPYGFVGTLVTAVVGSTLLLVALRRLKHQL
jgi:uncharacterized membrane protein YeaQ/YmgE (transglycosylase-associated protein family)